MSDELEFKSRRSTTTMPILLVDDNEINLLFLERILKDRGFTNITRAVSAEAALESIGETPPDIILLDVIMPGGMDGYTLCRNLRAQARFDDLPILMQTSITDPELRYKAFQSGATDFVSKPLYPDELYARVRVHLEKRQHLRELQQFRQRISIEMESARQLQLSILPTSIAQQIASENGMDIVGYFEPCSEIGGDFWGVKTLHLSSTAMWLVDFSGHGTASALNAFRLHAYLKEHSENVTRPGDYLSHLNDRLLSLLIRGQFAAMFYGIADRHTNQLHYACAAIPSPLLFNSKFGKIQQIDGSGIPLGIGIQSYASQTVGFCPGDILLLYSDALIETPNKDGAYITTEEISELIIKNAHQTAAHICDIIVGHFCRHSGNKLYDDLTIVVCRHHRH